MKAKKLFKLLVIASLLTGVIGTFAGPDDTGGRPPVVMRPF